MSHAINHSRLAAIEPKLRDLLPADLYATMWVDPTPANLTRVFEHLRTLQRILQDYLPRQVTENPPRPGEVRYEWQEGALMFTDLAGFTRLMEANAGRGREGAEALLKVFNAYFASMIEIISKAGGNLLEFTGDAMLAQFPADQRGQHTAQAVRAGLRMQRAMQKFANIETDQGPVSLGMRLGIHTGRFLTADIGTPRRMEHVLLGRAVLQTKHAEGAGQVSRVCLTGKAADEVRGLFRYETGEPDHALIMDDLTTQQLGEYDLAAFTRRPANTLLLDRSEAGLVEEIAKAIESVQPLASYIPGPVRDLIIESAWRRRISPDFAEPTVMFVNLHGLTEALELARPDELPTLVETFSRALAAIDAAVEIRGGVLKKITYQHIGSDIMIYFGVPNAHTNDPARAASAALAIRDIIAGLKPPAIGGQPINLHCQIGLSRGPVFAAEIGEPRGRREFNIMSDTVNTTARLAARAGDDQILLTESVHQHLGERFVCESLGPMALKGKQEPVPIYLLKGKPA
jgi:class 3 adenylate cyclase